MPFMLLVSHHASPLSGWRKVTLSLLLWAMATAWSGMLESKRWSLPLEFARVLAMGLAVTEWLVQAQTPPAGGALCAGWLLVSLAWLGGVPARRPHASGAPADASSTHQ
jgi:hypothetical protein